MPFDVGAVVTLTRLIRLNAGAYWQDSHIRTGNLPPLLKPQGAAHVLKPTT